MMLIINDYWIARVIISIIINFEWSSVVKIDLTMKTCFVVLEKMSPKFNFNLIGYNINFVSSFTSVLTSNK